MTPKSNVVVFDLDDTLYKEVDYLKSAYTEIAKCVEADDDSDIIVEKMLTWWKNGENVFQRLIETYQLDMTVDDLLTKYRTHIPKISLDEETKEVLQRMKDTAVLGIITDGRSNTQHNKIAALGLDGFMDEEDILVSGDREKDHEFHELHEERWEKPSELPFKYFMERYSANHSANRSVNRKPYTVRSANGRLLPTGRKNYYYVGDNTSKDFVAPNRLGWTTICLLDDGRNIHKQDFSLPQDMLPQHKISKIRDIENIII